MIYHKLVIAYYWRLAHVSCGLKPSWKELRRVFALYRTGDRHYHTLRHIAECLLWMRKTFPNDTHPVVIMALIYHDCIYDVQSKANEELSAEEFTFYAAGVFSERFVRVCRDLIVATKSHSPSADRLTQVVLDCDLHILATDWKRYAKYAQDVWKEYSVFGREGYLDGRTKFLETASMEFSSAEMSEMNAVADANMAKELELLKTNPSYLLV